MNIEFLTSNIPINYKEGIEKMEERVKQIIENKNKELIWLLEHEAVLTAGTSAKNEDLLSNSLPVFSTNRGGKFTLHAPGQRVCYIMLNLKKRAKGRVPDPKKFIKTLEETLISTLSYFGVKGEIREDRVGVWIVKQSKKEEKIAAIGVRFKKGVTMHGFAVNINNDLSLFNNIVPCGIKEYGVCSLKSLGYKVKMNDFDNVLKAELKKRFINYE